MLLHTVAEPFFFGWLKVAARAAKRNCGFHVNFVLLLNLFLGEKYSEWFISKRWSLADNKVCKFLYRENKCWVVIVSECAYEAVSEHNVKCERLHNCSKYCVEILLSVRMVLPLHWMGRTAYRRTGLVLHQRAPPVLLLLAALVPALLGGCRCPTLVLLHL